MRAQIELCDVRAGQRAKPLVESRLDSYEQDNILSDEQALSGNPIRPFALSPSTTTSMAHTPQNQPSFNVRRDVEDDTVLVDRQSATALMRSGTNDALLAGSENGLLSEERTMSVSSQPFNPPGSAVDMWLHPGMSLHGPDALSNDANFLPDSSVDIFMVKQGLSSKTPETMPLCST